MRLNYLFGRPVRPARGTARGRAAGSMQLFVLGAYPSAVHVRWWMPGNDRPAIQAVAVADEPEPFWSGHDEASQVERWCREIEFRPAWGRVAGCGRLNGSSGAWVDQRVLRPLGVARAHAYITDCLDTYFESSGAATRLADPAIAAQIAERGITPARHRPHPSENEVVREALELHRARLLEELQAAQPACLVTLGNAAMRVIAALLERVDDQGFATSELGTPKLSPRADSYGMARRVRIGTREVPWLPLAHPGAPALYQRAHDRWIAERGVSQH